MQWFPKCWAHSPEGRLVNWREARDILGKLYNTTELIMVLKNYITSVKS
jgi:hypothetical protein